MDALFQSIQTIKGLYSLSTCVCHVNLNQFPHLMELPHGPQRFDLMSRVLPILQTLIAHGGLTLYAVHT